MSLRFWVEPCLFQVLGTRLCLVWQVLSRGTSFSDSWDLLFSWLGGEQGGGINGVCVRCGCFSFCLTQLILQCGKNNKGGESLINNKGGESLYIYSISTNTVATFWIVMIIVEYQFSRR